MPSLIGETVTLVVNFTNYADTLNDVDLVSQTFTVGNGIELQNIPISYTFTSGGFAQTISGSISVDVTASGYTVSFTGTQQAGQLTFALSSIADESAGDVTAAVQTGYAGIIPGVNQTYTPGTDSANGGTVIGGFNTYGYQPGVSLSQIVAFTLSDPTVPPAVTTNTGATVLEGGLHTITNSQLQATDSDTAAASLTYRITTLATNGTLFRDLDGDNVVDAGETRALNNTFTQADIDAGLIKYLHNGGETTSASFGFSVSDGNDTVTGNSFNFTVTPVNDAPTGSGVPATATVTEDVARALDLSAVTLADVDSTSLTLTLTASAGTMTAPSGGGVIVTGSGSGTLTLTGSAANLDSYLNIASLVQYTGAANASGSNAASVSVSVSDGTDTTSLGSVSIDITAVNDAPEVTAPASITVTEDVSTAITGISFADVDAGSASVTVTLSASSGSLAAISGGAVTVGGTASALTLTGSIANINTFIAGSNVSFTTAANATDAVTLTASIDDGGNSGTGGALTDSTTVTLNVTAVNDAPTGSGLPTDLTVTEDTAGNFDLSGLTLADVDSTGNLTLTLTASAGTMAASDAIGVTVGGSGSGTLTLTGLAGALNSYLSEATRIQYTGALNASGNNAATVSASVSDGAVSAMLGSVNMDITAVNDAPTGSGLPGDVTVTEDTASNLNLSGLTLADVDGSNLTLTLTASEGTMTASNATVTTMVPVPGPGYFDPILMIWMPGPPIYMPMTTTTVAVTGSGTGTLVLTGTAADLNAYLADMTKIQYTGALNDSGDNAATVSASVSDGQASTPLGTVNIDITGVDDAAIAKADAFTITDVQALNGNVFADNGNGADSDVDTALAVTAVNGQAGNVGTQITLASGALLTLNANGTFDYDPNGKFEHLPAGASATDSFTYAVNGVEATVTLTINGIDNNDRFDGTADPDTFAGGLLSDTLLGAGGDDTLSGDSGDDDLQGGEGNDLLSGGTGADTLAGGAGIDTADYEGSAAGVTINLLTGTGSGGDAEGDVLTGIEKLAGSALSDHLSGDAAANSLLGQAGADTLFGNGGNDDLYGGADADYLQGNTGNDNLYGGLGSDELRGGAGSDTLTGGEEADILIGGTGGDTAGYSQSAAAVTVSLLTGTGSGGDAEGDTLSEIENVTGSDHDDSLTGDAAANALVGNEGADTLLGNEGNDTLFGNDDNDYLHGNAGSDLLNGGFGDDELRGGRDNDTVLGGEGNDTIYGALGNDLLSGGTGADLFVFNSAVEAANVDIITDFETGQDKIVLHTGIFTAFAGEASVTMADHLRYDGATANLYYDADGEGGQEEMLLATVLTGGAGLGDGDFQLI